MKLVIVESPAKCKKIESYLGSGYKCVASFGHIRQIKNGLKSINFENYKIDFGLIPSKSKYIKNLRSMIGKANEVILATDDDREGEAIAWHICMSFKLPVKTTKRMIFHEITQKAIKESISHLTIINMKKVYAQLARQVLDIVVGYKMCPLLWKHITNGGFSKKSLSAGRCQTPALRLVYEQENLINNAEHKKVYDTVGKFINEEMDFKLNKKFESTEDIEKFLLKSKKFKHIITVGSVNTVEKTPPTPLTTSLLQQKSSNQLGYSPKQTMRLAQTLYENGYITYMRTDNKKYSKVFINDTKTYIKNKHGKEYVNDSIMSLCIHEGDETKTKKVVIKKKGAKVTKVVKSGKGKGKGKQNLAQEAHEAIRPTKIIMNTIALTKKITSKEKRLYELIWKITAESCMSNAEFYKIKAIVNAPLDCKYYNTQELVKFRGWMIYEKLDEKNANFDLLKNKNKIQTEQNDNRDEEVEYITIVSKVTMSNIKSHYTEARLIQMLEQKGIGRPSTFSSIISKIQDRGYVKKENIQGKKVDVIDYKLKGKNDNNKLVKMKSERVFGKENNKLKLQPLGRIVIDFLLDKFETIFNYDYTKHMEEKLDAIEQGREMIWHKICDDCNNDLNTKINSIDKMHKVRYKIDEEHTYMIARYGPVIKHEKDGEVKFLKVIKDVDIDRLKMGDYELEELLLKNGGGMVGGGSNILGKYKDEDIVLKKGKFGLYTSFGGKNYSLKYIKKKEDAIELKDVIAVIENGGKSKSNVLKKINDDASVRDGKYGPYVFYKSKGMTKPRFLKIKGVKWQEIDETWLEERLDS